MYDKSKALLDDEEQLKETKPLTEVKIYDSQTSFEEKKQKVEEDASITGLAEQTVKMAEAF